MEVGESESDVHNERILKITELEAYFERMKFQDEIIDLDTW